MRSEFIDYSATAIPLRPKTFRRVATKTAACDKLIARNSQRVYRRFRSGFGEDSRHHQHRNENARACETCKSLIP
jgi:hypothetical protein